MVSIQLGDSSAGTFRSLGASQFFLNNHEDARHFLQRAASIDEAEATTSYYLGLVWQKLGQQDSSISSFEKAIDLSRAKFIADALTQMSVSYELKENLVGAVTSLKKVHKPDAGKQGAPILSCLPL
jgi:tetratricopeptide (TPR) repeat protein